MIYTSKITNLVSVMKREVSRKCTSKFSENLSNNYSYCLCLRKQKDPDNETTSVYQNGIDFSYIPFKKKKIWMDWKWRLEQKLLFDCSSYWYDIVTSGIDRSESHKYLMNHNKRFRFQLKRESSPSRSRNFKLDYSYSWNRKQ